MKQDFYKNLQAEAQTQLTADEKLSGRYTLYRTACFFALIFAFAAGYDGVMGATVIGVLLLLFFSRLIHQHNRLKKRIRFIQNSLDVTEEYLSRFNGNWQNLTDKGDEFIHPERPQDIDLHIYGPASLYQYLCCARTALGRQKLAQALTVTPPPANIIAQRQAAVSELIDHQRLCVELLALSRFLPTGHDTAPLIKEVTADQPHHISPVLQQTARLLPLYWHSAALWNGIFPASSYCCNLPLPWSFTGRIRPSSLRCAHSIMSYTPIVPCLSAWERQTLQARSLTSWPITCQRRELLPCKNLPASRTM